MMYDNNVGGGGWVVAIIGMLIIVGLIVASVIWFVSARRSGPQVSVASAASADEILDQRLASGEITSEQYDGLRQTLAATTSSASRPTSAAGTPG
jgi:uncharacterized membrane protein